MFQMCNVQCSVPPHLRQTADDASRPAPHTLHPATFLYLQRKMAKLTNIFEPVLAKVAYAYMIDVVPLLGCFHVLFSIRLIGEMEFKVVFKKVPV